MATRQVSTQIPLSEIPFVMRALGHYPSEQEIEDMINEIKFSRYVDTGEYVSNIDLGTFIKCKFRQKPFWYYKAILGRQRAETAHANITCTSNFAQVHYGSSCCILAPKGT